MKPRILITAIALAIASCSNSDNPVQPDIDKTIPTGTASGTASDDAGNIPAQDDSEQLNNPVALDIVGQNLLASLAGIQADRMALALRDLADEIASSGEAMPQADSVFETLNGFGPEVIQSPTRVSVYSCNAGGQMMRESGQLRDGAGSELSLIADHDTFDFDACRHTEAGGLFAAGQYLLEGTVVMDASDYSTRRGGRSGHTNHWTGFSLSAPGGTEYELSGSVEVDAYSAAYFGSGDSRTVELAHYRKTVGGTTVESLEGVHLSLVRALPNGNDDSSYRLDANGVVLNAETNGSTVMIITDQVLSGRRVDVQGNAEVFNGQIRMIAENGGELILSGNPTSQITIEPGDLLVDFVALRPDGETVTGEAIPLMDILAGDIRRGCFLTGVLNDCSTVELP